MHERVLTWEGETIDTDADVSENLVVLMKAIECVLELDQSIISNDIPPDNVAELQERTECAHDILGNMALEGW